MKNKRNGFTLTELLIVVAIIGVLVAVSIPVFSQQLEKSREATDLANVRAKYAEVKAEAMTATTAYPIKKSVKLKQKQSDWQYYEPVVIAGIIHYRNDGNTDHWEGVPGAGGECIISYTPSSEGLKFIWSGGSAGGSDTGTKVNFTEDIHGVVKKTGLVEANPTTQFEIDSKCPDSKMVEAVKKELDGNSLLNHGTWAYLGDSRPNNKKMYLFWTSIDLTPEMVQSGIKVPVIVSKESGGYFISETTPCVRTRTGSGKKYATISDHIIPSGFSKYTTGTEYNSLEDAYKAYENLLKTDSRYTQYQDTLPK